MSTQLITLFFSILLFLSCNKKEYLVVEADLTFNSISFMSAYGASEEEYATLNHDMDSVLMNPTKNETTKLYKHFSKLKEKDLLKSPYIFLKIDNDSVLPVYVSDKQYVKVRGIKHIDLVKENKKAILKIKLSKIDNNIYFSDSIIEVKKINGRSRSNLTQK
ncbi:MAG: hypothetical protein ACSHXF_01595 [Aquaticitalea sp.]